MNHAAKKQQGFTIIELMLAMSFIAVLLIAIAMTIVQIGSIYNKGLTLKEVNQTGRDLTDDIRRTVAIGGQVDLANDYREVVQGTQVIGGRLCLGSSSYVWNYAAAIESNNTRLIKYPTGTEEGPIRLVKVPDGAKAYCSVNGEGQLDVPNLLPVDVAESRELLRSGDRTLSLHAFKITTSDSASDASTGQRLYRVTFTLGTERTDLLNLTAKPITCKTPSEIGSDLNYCTVQEFSIVVRAGNGV